MQHVAASPAATLQTAEVSSVLLTLATIRNAAAPVGDLAPLESAAAQRVELRRIVAAQCVADGVVDENLEPFQAAAPLAMREAIRSPPPPARVLEVYPLLGHRGQRHAIDATKLSVCISDQLTQRIVHVRDTGARQPQHL